jgi:hypothetical protein
MFKDTNKNVTVCGTGFGMTGVCLIKKELNVGAGQEKIILLRGSLKRGIKFRRV